MALSLGWFSTGRGPGSRGLLQFVQDEIRRGDLPAKIAFVFSSREPGEAEGSDLFIDLVRRYNLPLVTFSWRRFRHEFKGDTASRRLEFDRRAMALLKRFNPDFCVLAGYMLIVGSEMCHRYTMLNLHPALPKGPVGTWQEVIWQLIETRARETGAMVHLAVEKVDQGPVVSYFTMPLTGAGFDEGWAQIEGRSIDELKTKYSEDLPLFREIRQEEYRREPYLLSETIRALALGQVVVKNFQVFDRQGRLSSGLCLNERIEKLLKSVRQ